VITGAKSHPNTPNTTFFQAVNSLKPTHNSLTKISGIYPHTREQTIEELSKLKNKGLVDIDRSTIEAYIHFASDGYDAAFKEDNAHNQAWWDGALAMARWIQEADGQ
jgi:hypothetical protein|tara:strand:+ start:1618 stop:1938 length:321 start_codon:yes stop_codon:yes gene_type:complete